VAVHIVRRNRAAASRCEQKQYHNTGGAADYGPFKLAVHERDFLGLFQVYKMLAGALIVRF
jgi:hypothetical protein